MTVVYDGQMYLLNLHSYTCWKPLRLKTALCVVSMRFGERPRSLLLGSGTLVTRSWYSKSMDLMHGQLPHDFLWSKLELQAEHLPTSTRFSESNSPRRDENSFSLRVAHIEASRCALFSMQASIGWSESECFVERFCQFQIFRSVHGWTFVWYSPEVLLNTATAREKWYFTFGMAKLQGLRWL